MMWVLLFVPLMFQEITIPIEDEGIKIISTDEGTTLCTSFGDLVICQ